MNPLVKSFFAEKMDGRTYKRVHAPQPVEDGRERPWDARCPRSKNV